MMSPIATSSRREERERIILVYEANHVQTMVMNKVKEEIHRHFPDRFSIVNINELLDVGVKLTTQIPPLMKTSYRTMILYCKDTSSAIIDAVILSGVLQVIRTEKREKVIVLRTANDKKTMPVDLQICAQLQVDSDWMDLSFMKNTLLGYMCTTNYALRGTLELYNVGYCMAVGLLCGFINGYFDKLRLKMRDTTYYNDDRLSLKMYILLPKSYRMPDDGGFIDGRRIKLVPADGQTDTVVENVAGITKRVYKNNICRIRANSGEYYYAHVEYGTALSSLKAAYDDKLVPIPPDDWAFLEKEMKNYGQLLMRLDGMDRVRVIFYDDEAADWTADSLPDMLVAEIKKDIGKPDPKIPTNSKTDGDIQTEEEKQTVMILPVGSSAEVDFPDVFTALRRLDDSRREVVWHSGNPANSSAALGESILDSFEDSLERCKYFVVVATRRDFPGPGGAVSQEAGGEFQSNFSQLALEALLTKLIPRREMSLVLLTDCTDTSDISHYLSPFFLKLIRLRVDSGAYEIYDELEKALDPNPVHGIKYLNIGHCLAMEYYYSYLRYKLPKLDQCYAGRGWTYRGVTIPRKLFVVLQRSAKITLAADNNMVEEEAYAPSTIKVMRACARREYPSTLYRISHANKECYALVELAACVRTVQNVADEYKLGDKWKDEEAGLFQKTLTKVLLHERTIAEGHRRHLKFIFYDDINADKPLSEVLAEAIFEEFQVGDGVALTERADTSHGSSPHGSSSPYNSVTSVDGGGDSCDASTESRTVSDPQSTHFGSGDDNDQSVIEEHGPVEVADGSRGDANEMRNERPAGAECENVLSASVTHVRSNGFPDETDSDGLSVNETNLSASSSLHDRNDSCDSLSHSDADRTHDSNISLDDEFYDAVDGNRTNESSIGDESNYQSMLGDSSAAFFSDTVSENSDISTLSPDDEPETTDASTFLEDSAMNDSADLEQRIARDVTPRPCDLNESRLLPPMSSPLVHEEMFEEFVSELTFGHARPEPSMSDESNIASLEEVPSVSLPVQQKVSPRSRAWRGRNVRAMTDLVQEQETSLASVLGEASSVLLRGYRDELTQMAAQEIVNIVDNVV